MMKMDSWLDSSSLLSPVLVLSFSLLCGFTPVCVTRRAARSSSETGLLALASCLSSGVFLASCLLDVLPEYLTDMTDTFSRQGITLHFPLAEFILAMGFLVVLVMEQMLQAFREQPSEASLEKQALMEAVVRSGRGQEEGRGAAGLRLLLLLFCLCERSLLDGLSTAARLQRPLQAAGALLLYEGLLAFSVAVRLAHLGLRRTVLSGCLLLFCVSCPAGIGLALAGLKTGAQMELVRCAVRGLTAGIFINISVSGLTWPEPGSPKHRIHKVAFLLSGFALVTAVLLSRV